MPFGYTTSTGYVHKRYSDILEEMQLSLTAKGYSVGSYDPISVMLSIAAASLSLTWEALQFAFWQNDEDKISKGGLDVLYGRLNLYRQPAQPTSGFVTFTGSDLTVIPDQTLLETVRGAKFQTVGEFTISGTTAIVPVVALVNGPTIVLTNELTNMLQVISGVTVTNNADLLTGRLEEKDNEFRIRKKTFVRGAGTVPAIKSKLFNVSGVSDLVVVANFYPTVDSEGRAPQSVEAVVIGGADQDIIDVLGGDVSAGNITDSTAVGVDKVVGSYTDPVFGKTYPVEFSRPNTIIGSLSIILYVYSPIPADEIEKLRAAVIDYKENLRIGDDVRHWEIRALVDVITDTQNIKNVDTLIGLGAPPAWSASQGIPTPALRVVSIDSTDILISQTPAL